MNQLKSINISVRSLILFSPQPLSVKIHSYLCMCGFVCVVWNSLLNIKTPTIKYMFVAWPPFFSAVLTVPVPGDILKRDLSNWAVSEINACKDMHFMQIGTNEILLTLYNHFKKIYTCLNITISYGLNSPKQKHLYCKILVKKTLRYKDI